MRSRKISFSTKRQVGFRALTLYICLFCKKAIDRAKSPLLSCFFNFKIERIVTWKEQGQPQLKMTGIILDH